MTQQIQNTQNTQINESSSLSNINTDVEWKKRIFSKYREACSQPQAFFTFETPTPKKQKSLVTVKNAVMLVTSLTLAVQIWFALEGTQGDDRLLGLQFKMDAVISKIDKFADEQRDFRTTALKTLAKLENMDSLKLENLMTSLHSEIIKMSESTQSALTLQKELVKNVDGIDKVIEKQMSTLTNSAANNFVRVIDAADKLAAEAAKAKSVIEELKNTFKKHVQSVTKDDLTRHLSKVIANFELPENA